VGFLTKKRRRSSRNRSLLGSLPLVRWFGPGLTAAGVLTAVFGVITGRIDLSALDQYRGETAPIALRPISLRELGEKTADTIRIGTFNIKQFADAKANDATVMQRIAQIVNEVDLLAIQEVMAQGRPIDRLVSMMNQSVGQQRYASLVSVPIGRTSHKESYAYVWDTSRISHLPDTAYVVDDAGDLMHREPYVASFQVRLPAGERRRPFQFTLINVHTDPDEVSGRSNELNALDDVFESVRYYEYQTRGERDYLLLGDLNAQVTAFAELGEIQGVVSLVGNQITNLAGTKSIDHILIDRFETTEVISGRTVVVDLVDHFGITQKEAAAISDHLPVIAEFSAYELPEQQNVATGPQNAGQR